MSSQAVSARSSPTSAKPSLRGRAECRAQHRNRIRIRIVLVEDPRIRREATKRLGYSLETNYPKLCRVVATRHAKYRKAQFKSIRHKLKEALHEEPPSFRAVAGLGA
jgi:hypothetical protein